VNHYSDLLKLYVELAQLAYHVSELGEAIDDPKIKACRIMLLALLVAIDLVEILMAVNAD
jgi:hypothetical protein